MITTTLFILPAESSQQRLAKEKNNWGIQYIEDNKFLTNTLFRNMGYIIDKNNNTCYTHEQLLLSVGEHGERFTPFVKNGQVVDIWNENEGTNTEKAKNIPFYMTNRGYGMFVNSSSKVSYDVGSEKVSRVQFSNTGAELE